MPHKKVFEKLRTTLTCKEMTSAVRVIHLGILAAACLLVPSILYVTHRRKKFLASTTLKGDLGYWLIGEMPAYLFSPTQFYRTRLTKLGKNFVSHLFLTPLVVITEPVDYKEILHSEAWGLTSVSWPEHIQEILGKKSITVNEGEEHQRLRLLFTRSLTQSNVRLFIPNFVQASSR